MEHAREKLPSVGEKIENQKRPALGDLITDTYQAMGGGQDGCAWARRFEKLVPEVRKGVKHVGKRALCGKHEICIVTARASVPDICGVEEKVVSGEDGIPALAYTLT